MTMAPFQPLSILGLERSPFPTTPDSSAWFATPQLEGELAETLHCLHARAGFVLLTGEVGTGKTTFIRRVLEQAAREGLVSSLVFNTFLQSEQLLAAILRDFGLEPRGRMADDVETLNRFLLELSRNGHGCVLVIDDAQALDLDSLELLRLLSNIETGREKLLQIVLSGQPELCARLDQPCIRQLTSRIVKHVRLDALDPAQVHAYVHHRLDATGAAGGIGFDRKAADALWRLSRGNPRRIHMVMERCLYGLVARNSRDIDAALLRQADAEAGVLAATRRSRLPKRWLPALAATMAVAAVFAAAGIASRSPHAGGTAAGSPGLPRLAAVLPLAHDVTGPWRDCIDLPLQSAHRRAGASMPAPPMRDAVGAPVSHCPDGMSPPPPRRRVAAARPSARITGGHAPPSATAALTSAPSVPALPATTPVAPTHVPAEQPNG